MPKALLAVLLSCLVAAPAFAQAPEALGDAAWSAYRAGDRRKAKRYARRALTRAATAKTKEELGRVVFQAHDLLGVLDLDKGDVTGAEKQLAALTTKKAPPTSAVPSEELARRLFELGRVDAVKRFFEELPKVCPQQSEAAAAALKALAAGQRPAFVVPL